MTRVVVLNVGANKKDPGARGPIFEDGTFRFIPITETDGYAGLTYRDLGLEAYVPETSLEKVAHQDPEFKTFTYGHAKRVGDWKALQQTQPGDYLFFMVTLDFHGLEQKRAKWINPNWGAYLIGYFRILHVIEGEEFPDQPDEVQRLFRRNAHYEDGAFLGDMAIKGDKHSAMLRVAVPLSDPVTSHLPNQLARDVFLAEWLEENPGREPRGWYRWTRSCKDDRKVVRLWREVNRLNPGQSKYAQFT